MNFIALILTACPHPVIAGHGVSHLRALAAAHPSVEYCLGTTPSPKDRGFVLG